MIKVMLVDDEDTVRSAIKRLMIWEKLDVKIIGSCSNAVEALNMMTNEMPDILITDVKMPIMNGIELIQRAKEMYPFLQCVILSGYDEFSLAQSAMLSGVRHYLLKPCTKEKLENVILECVEQMEKDKKAIIQDDSCRGIVIEKLITDLLELTFEENETNAECVKEVMSSYGDIGLLREAATHLALKYRSEEEYGKTISLISQIFKERTDIYECVVQILNELSRIARSDESFVEKIKKYIDENYYLSNLSLRYIADHVVYMNAQYVGKQFYKQIGMKLSEYLLKVRMEHTMLLLTGSKELKMYEIAEKVGLGKNIQYFYLLFKRYTGVTPKEYQEIHSKL